MPTVTRLFHGHPRLFRGHPRLLYRAVPGALAVVGVKAVLDATGWQPLDFSPLLTGVIAAEVFILGFLLSGTASDFKEAEHLPSEIAAGLETMADECLIVDADMGLPEARGCLGQLVTIAERVRSWLGADHGVDEVLKEIRALNPYFLVFAPKIQPGFTTRLKGEQAALRSRVLRMDTMRRTSYVSAAYLAGELVGVLLVVVLLLTDMGATAPTLMLVGVIAFLLFYLFALIRDLDDPFQYPDGKQGAADVSLAVLDDTATRLSLLLAASSGRSQLLEKQAEAG